MTMGYLLSIIVMLYSEYFTSHFFKPVRSLVRIAEDGEFYNIISSNIYGSMTYIIPAFFISVVYLISHGLLHEFGVALAALGCLVNFFTL